MIVPPWSNPGGMDLEYRFWGKIKAVKDAKGTSLSWQSNFHTSLPYSKSQPTFLLEFKPSQ